ncbi:uncharacterized protein N7515_009778 [Penicillium bovifimosum]|uniref:Uncharacterized protein n=1 Tax=Penicillium bovifimosum TaxID=126998 RepID=A0A9W9GH78_9EURO|nr:uncharacterized protein N7515_009778 [Penicillium bovifimosum]KAJ5120390.1 hypothetical protein N7515_009778 [Penicillium bovifimosum]
MSIVFDSLPLPPPMSEFGEPFYRSVEQAIEAINIHPQPQGFAVSTRGSHPNRVRIHCARSRGYKAQKTTNRHSTTRSTECPYRAVLHRRPDPDDGPIATTGFGISRWLRAAITMIDNPDLLSLSTKQDRSSGIGPKSLLESIKAARRLS